MEKHYQIQFTLIDGEEKWVDRWDSGFPYSEEGLASAIDRIRHLHKIGDKTQYKYRLTCVSTEVMDIHL